MRFARRDSGVWPALDVIARQPVIDAPTLERELGTSNVHNVSPLLRRLSDEGILRSKAEHGFGNLWRSDEVLAALDAFAARSGRRA